MTPKGCVTYSMVLKQGVLYTLLGTVKHCQAVGHYQALSGTVGLLGCREGA